MEKLAQKYGAPIGVTCLIVSALLWGGEYVVAKDVLDIVPANWCNAVRAFITAVFAFIIWHRHFKEAKLHDWIRGLICGALFGMGSALQLMGLETTNAGVNAFIASAYVVLVPFMVWAVERKCPAAKVFVSALIGISGVTIMSVTGFSTGNLHIGVGEILTLLSALGYGGAMVSADYFTEKTSVEFITACQFIMTAVIGLIFGLLIEDVPHVTMTVPIVLEFAYLVLFGTFVTQLLFTFGVKYASANQAGVIFPLESVSATVFGCLCLHEQLKAVQVIGGLLIIAAVVISSVSFGKSEGSQLADSPAQSDDTSA